jgi:hypothetical protein
MAPSSTASRLSSGKTSKKQTISSMSTDNNATLTNLMLTAELLTAPSIKVDEKPSIEPTMTSPSLLRDIKNSAHFSTMVISLTCAFLVSAAFYWAAKTMMKTKFEDMFAEKLPRYKSLLYGIGSVQNIDIDRVLMRDDLNDQYFVLDENSSNINIDVQKIFEQYKQEQLSINQETKEMETMHTHRRTAGGKYPGSSQTEEDTVRAQANQKSSV